MWWIRRRGIRFWMGDGCLDGLGYENIEKGKRDVVPLQDFAFGYVLAK